MGADDEGRVEMPPPRRPAHEYRDAEPYQPGNLESVHHGTLSARLVSAKTEEIRSELIERFPLLADPMFADSFERCVSAQARATMLNDYIWGVVEGTIQARSRQGFPSTGIEAVPAYLWGEVTKAEGNAAKFAQDCGLDPIGFAKLAKELGWAKQLSGSNVAGLMTTGRELRRGPSAARSAEPQ